MLAYVKLCLLGGSYFPSVPRILSREGVKPFLSFAIALRERNNRYLFSMMIWKLKDIRDLVYYP